MSKVRPTRCPQPSPGTEKLVVLGSRKTSGESSTNPKPSRATKLNSDDEAVFKMFRNFASDSTYSAMNPLFVSADEAAMPPDLPTPMKPTVPTSYSMPTLATTLTSLVSPTRPPTDDCCTVTSVSSEAYPSSPSNLSPPPNTPLSPLSVPGSPVRHKTHPSFRAPSSNPLSPDIIPPPNTPLSPMSHITSPQLEADQYVLGRSNICADTARPNEGPLYNILSPDLVDLTNLRHPTGDVFPTSAHDPRCEGKSMCPFSAYPNHYCLDHDGDAEKVIKDLVNLGNGVYDNKCGRKDYSRPKCNGVLELPGKSEDWNKLEEKQNLVAACWSHNLTSAPEDLQSKEPEKYQSTSNEVQKPQKETKSGGPHEETPEESNRTIIPETNEQEDQRRRSRYHKLKIPMIDDDLDSQQPDSSSPTESDTSSSLSLDFLGPGAAQLAEQLCDVTSEAGRLISQEVQQGINYLTQPEDTLEFGWIDAVTGIISIVTFYFDLVSDALVAYYMHDDRDAKYWFLFTLLLLVLPMVVVNGFSLYWYWFDERSCEPQASPRHPRVPNYVWIFRVVAHLLLQAPVLRQADIIYYGTKSTAETVLQEALVDEVMEAALVTNGSSGQKTSKGSSIQLSLNHDAANHNPPASNNRPTLACSARTGGMCARGGYVALWIHAERDASNVELLLALMQDAPLLILHLYIMAHTLPSQALEGRISHTLIMQMLSVTMSLLTLAWSVASFVRATRLTEPSLGNLSILDLLLLTLAHFCSIAAQVMSFSLFASKLVVAFFVMTILHWLIMTFWVLTQLLCFPRTTCSRAFFAHDRQQGLCHWLDDVLFSSVMGVIFLFTFVDVGGIAARTQSLLYHVLTLMEEMLLLAVWLVYVSGWAWYHWLPLMLAPVLFCLNLVFDALFAAHARPAHCLLLNTAPKAL
ncbi:uncharacterized protein [Panulirus ornatus]|uniref:uncharacterized protein n=1 Tax=Panulirus ornatus TaxID=150431 RepID=UPI003A8A5B07